jgi:hypothetical protein
MVTEHSLFIEKKGVDGFEIDNCLHILMSANSDWVVPASLDERRFACFDLDASHQQKDEYFSPLYTEIRNGGTGAMLYDLQRIDLEGWHPRQNVPKTTTLRDQQEQSLSYFDQWWLSLLEAGTLPGAVLSNPRRAASDKLFEHARSSNPGLRFTSDHLLARILKKHGCRAYRSGSARGWEFPSLPEARAMWEEHMSMTWVSPNQIDWDI